MPLPREELLHHIWQHRLFDQTELKTTEGEKVSIIRPGTLNQNAGPDFSAARVKVGATEWSGNVEIHIQSSDWLKHQHQDDEAYSNIILHVVFEDDLEESTGSFPTLQLKSHISDQILRRYEAMDRSKEELACGSQFSDVPSLVFSSWIDSLIVQRLQSKAERINENLNRFHGDVEQVFQMTLFRAFGMKVNAVPFEMLGLITPWKTLAKYRDNLFQLEAILFGYAGFLQFPEEEYQTKLAKEYEFVENKHGAEGLGANLFKFSRMHPKNFPTLRLAQLAALYHRTGQFLSWFRAHDVPTLLNGMLVEPSEYWQTHYRFGKEFPTKGNRVGAGMANNVLINVLAPFLFVLSEREGKPELKDKAISILEELKPEKNSKVKAFEDAGFKLNNALDSQALIELKTNYCELKKCLFCNVGANILRSQK